MKRIICLSGLAGSGKSTIGKQLAAHLELPFLSIGNFTREYAASLGLDIHQFQDLAAKTPGLDEEIDKAFISKINLIDGCVLDYRLGFHFIKTAYNVLLTIDDEEAAKRVLSRSDVFDGHVRFVSVFDQMRLLKKRNSEMRHRLQRTYGVDFTDQHNYDLVLDTTNIPPAECIRIILKAFHNQL